MQEIAQARRDTLLIELRHLDPPNAVGARRAVMRARCDLRDAQRDGAAEHVVDCHRYRVERAIDVLREAEQLDPRQQ